MSFELLFWILFFAIITYLVVRRIAERKSEDFEQRDN
jgi:hypothetical protein